MVNCLTVNRYFVKSATATYILPSVTCDFDDDGSANSALFNSALIDEYPTGTCPKCLPRKDFVYGRQQFGQLSRSIKSMERFLPPREWQTLQVDAQDAGCHRRTDEAGRWDHSDTACEDFGRAWVQGFKDRNRESKTNPGVDIPW